MKVGFIAPLSEPGWKEAGAQLLAGFLLGVDEAKRRGGGSRQEIEVMVRDTAGDPAKAEAALNEMKIEGVAAVSGEYHSLVARVAANTADELQLPYLCSSAVIHKIVERPSNWIARLSPPQTLGWQLYADFLVRQGHHRVATVSSQGSYWENGVKVLRARLSENDALLADIPFGNVEPDRLAELLADLKVSAILLLLGFPEPAISVARAIREDRRLTGVLLGAPAGQPEFRQWHAELGKLGANVPFLRYLPTTLSEYGQRALRDLRQKLGNEPSFVASEGLDSARVILGLMERLIPSDEPPWASLCVEGSRGRIAFTFDESSGAWQWAGAPVHIAALNALSRPEALVLYPR